MNGKINISYDKKEQDNDISYINTLDPSKDSNPLSYSINESKSISEILSPYNYTKEEPLFLGQNFQEKLTNLIFPSKEMIEEEDNKSLNSLSRYLRECHDLSKFDVSKNKENNIINTKNGEIINRSKVDVFKTKFIYKRGRKTSYENKIPVLKRKRKKRFHGKDDFDNMERKTQVHFINFLLSFSNDIATYIYNEEKEINKKKFLDIEHKFKSIVSHDSLEETKKLKLYEVLSQKISKKYLKYSENNNIILLKDIEKKDHLLSEIFRKNIMELFREYYWNEGKDLKEINYKGISIKTSKQTKNLNYLLMKNIHSKKKYENLINDVYFDGKINLYRKRNESKLFVIKPNIGLNN